MSLVGKSVLVTGGTSGIGLAIAALFVAEGARVAVCARTQAGLDNFTSSYPDSLAIKADVTLAKDRATLLDAVAMHFGQVDILVNNVGKLIEHDFTDSPPATRELDRDLALNFIAPIQLTSDLLTRWPEPDALLFVTSGYAFASPRRAPTYGAAKAGLHAFANGLRRQFAGTGTQVIEIVPPVVDTPATANSTASKISPGRVAEATLNALRSRKPAVFVGPAKLLPTLLRLAPRFAERMVAET